MFDEELDIQNWNTSTSFDYGHDGSNNTNLSLSQYDEINNLRYGITTSIILM